MSPASGKTPRTGSSGAETRSVRTGLDATAIAQAIVENLHCLQARYPGNATLHDWYMALAYTVRDRMLQRYINTLEAIADTHVPIKVVAYMSAEFLTGPTRHADVPGAHDTILHEPDVATLARSVEEALAAADPRA